MSWFGVMQAFKFKDRAKEINDLVISVMGALEKAKPTLTLDKENDR
jgi:hypothetical protein